jgi:hypothetical protein
MSWASARFDGGGTAEEEEVEVVVEVDEDGGGWAADFGIEGDCTALPVPTERGRFKGGLREGAVASN